MLKTILLTLIFCPMAFANGETQNLIPANDSQIIDVVYNANDADIEVSKFAQKRTTDTRVRELAKHLVTDHENLNQAIAKLMKETNLQREKSDVSTSIKKDAEAFLASVMKERGPSFDGDYLDHEITYHEAIIQSFNKSLLPTVKNAQLKDLLQQGRGVLISHLAQAKEVQEATHAPVPYMK